MKIAIFEIEPWERQAFEGLEGAHDLVYENGPMDSRMAEQYDDADIVSTFIHSSLDRDVVQQFSRLKLIATRSTGFDHIDLDTCTENGIQVANVPTYGDNTVAEHVFALLLAIREGVFLVKPNRRELQELIESDLDTAEEQERAAQQLVDGGASEIVALTLGADGAVFAWSGAWSGFQPPRSQPAARLALAIALSAHSCSGWRRMVNWRKRSATPRPPESQS